MGRKKELVEDEKRLASITKMADDAHQLLKESIRGEMAKDIEKEIEDVRRYLHAHIVLLNGLDVSEYVGEHGRIKNNVYPYGIIFKKNSILWTSSKYFDSEAWEPVRVGSQLFGARFLTALLTLYIDQLDKIVMNYRQSGMKVKNKKILSHCITNIFTLVTNILIGHSYYPNMAITIYEVLAWESEDKRAREYCQEMRKLETKDWSADKFARKSIPLVYFLYTGKKLDGSVKIEAEGIGGKMTKKQYNAYLKLLGGLICKQSNISKLARIFTNCDVRLKPRKSISKGKSIKEQEQINTALNALAFWAWVSDDKKVFDFVNNFLKF